MNAQRERLVGFLLLGPAAIFLAGAVVGGPDARAADLRQGPAAHATGTAGPGLRPSDGGGDDTGSDQTGEDGNGADGVGANGSGGSAGVGGNGSSGASGTGKDGARAGVGKNGSPGAPGKPAAAVVAVGHRDCA